MKLSKYYTVEQVAAFFGVTRSSIDYAISRGAIKKEYFGKKKAVIHETEIEQLKKRWKTRKKTIERPHLKPGEYYDIEEAAESLGITISIIFDLIRLGIIKVDYLDKKKIAIHETHLQQIKTYRSKLTKRDDKRNSQYELARLGFTYSRNPPPGAPRGSSRHPSPLRRGWSKDGVYYGLTAIEALRKWRQSSK